MRRPNKPHVDGYEDEEDCEGYYDQWEAERRRCHNIPTSQRNVKDPCRICVEKYRSEETARQKAEWDTKTPDEKAQQEAMIKGLRELY